MLDGGVHQHYLFNLFERISAGERRDRHCHETGAMRRTHLRRRDNIAKRLLIHVGGFNLSLVMRQLVGFGTPRRLQGRCCALFAALCALWMFLAASARRVGASDRQTGIWRPRQLAA